MNRNFGCQTLAEKVPRLGGRIWQRRVVILAERRVVNLARGLKINQTQPPQIGRVRTKVAMLAPYVKTACLALLLIILCERVKV